MKIKWITIIYSMLLLLLIAVADQNGFYYQWVLKTMSFIPYGDKIGHFLLMGILALTVNLSFHCHQFKLFNIFFLTGSTLILLIVTLEEFSQLLISSRTFDLGDLLADYIGILLFGQLAKYYHFRQSHLLKPAILNDDIKIIKKTI